MNQVKPASPCDVPLIGFGYVRHKRLRPRVHRFVYPIFFSDAAYAHLAKTAASCWCFGIQSAWAYWVFGTVTTETVAVLRKAVRWHGWKRCYMRKAFSTRMVNLAAVLPTCLGL